LPQAFDHIKDLTMKAKTLLCAGALVLTSALPVAQAQIAGIQPLGGTSGRRHQGRPEGPARVPVQQAGKGHQAAQDQRAINLYRSLDLTL
jgi:hypothetical protein